MAIDLFRETDFAEALEPLLLDPHANALMVSSLFRFRNQAIYLWGREGREILGLLAVHNEPVCPAIYFWGRDHDVFRSLLLRATAHLPELRGRQIRSFADQRCLDLLDRAVRFRTAREELQLKLNPVRHITGASTAGNPRVEPLTESNLQDLDALYRIVPPEVWRPEEASAGPYRGVYENGMLVAVAGVHWVSPWIAEIGNVAVHPDYRRRGLAEACVGAVVEDLKTLTEKVYLTVLADNEPAIRLYRKMGFDLVQRIWLVEFRLVGVRQRRRGRGLAPLRAAADGDRLAITCKTR